MRLSADQKGMRYHAKVRAGIQPFLPEGEEYVAAFPAMGGFIIGLAHRYRVVVVTDKNVHLYSAAWFSICKPKRYLATHPEGQPLRSRRKVLNEVLQVAGERVWVKMAHHEELRQAIWASQTLTQPSPI